MRNFEHLLEGLKDIQRVLKPGAKLVVLEFSRPNTFPVKQVYNFYFRFVLPLVGRLVSKDSAAYTYLPASVQVFPEGNAFLGYMEQAGFVKNQEKQTLYDNWAFIKKCLTKNS